MATRLALRTLLACFAAAAIACAEVEPPPLEKTDDRAVDDDREPSDEASDGDDSDGDVSADDRDDTGDEQEAPSRDAATGDATGDSRADGGRTVADAGAANDDDAKGGADTDAAAGDGGEEDSEVDETRLKPKCMEKDSQLIVIGDSYINWPITHTFPEDMAAASMQRWRMEAVGGYSMATGGTGLIPPLFDAAIRRDADAHTVLMDGGGNDILLGDVLRQCRDENAPEVAECQRIVQAAIDASEKLMERMVDAGIRDVVYFFYPHVPENTALGGPNPNHILDYSLPLVKDFCESREDATGGKLRCTFIDMVPVFAGKPQGEWFFPGDIHPTPTGSKAMAEEIWKVMTNKCIGQKGPMDCCES